MATAPSRATSSVLASAAPVVDAQRAQSLHLTPPEEQAPPPEPYYWEEGGAGESVPPVKLVTHNLHWIGMQLFTGVEYMGEIFSEFFGMSNSRYEWALQAAREAEEEAAEEERRELQRQRWAAIQQLNAAEAGRTAAGAGGAAAPSQAGTGLGVPATAPAVTISTPATPVGTDVGETNV